MSEIEKVTIQTERGMARDLSTVPISPPEPSGQGPDWFGPRVPMRPTAPPEVAGRVRDYLVGVNLTTQARPEEIVGFQELRLFADACDIVRLLIERRKDQLVRQKWTVRAKKGRNVDTDLLDYVLSFLERPHFEFDFADFVRILTEDLFVLDAPTIFLDRRGDGRLRELRPVDGAVIKRIIDDWGQLPRPMPWQGEAFSWNGDAIDRTNFAGKGWHYDAASGLLFPPAYQAVLKGLPAVSYSTRQISQKRFNPRSNSSYGRSVVESIMRTIATAAQRAASQLSYFTEGNQPESLFALPSAWTPDQVQRYQEYWDNQLSGNLANRRKLKFIAGDGQLMPIKEPPLKSEIDEWLARIACFAFSYPPTPFIRELNKSTAQSHDKTAEEEGLQPIKLFFASWFNELIRTEFGTDDLEFAWIEEEEVDQEKQSEILDRLVAGGIMSVAEAREKLGLAPVSDPAASIPMVRTATGFVPISGAAKPDEVTDANAS
jgi:hypothetical protein